MAIDTPTFVPSSALFTSAFPKCGDDAFGIFPKMLRVSRNASKTYQMITHKTADIFAFVATD